MQSKHKNLDKAKQVLKQNTINGVITPSKDLYPHAWLWDSCFIAIGVRHYNTPLARRVLLDLKKGQWENGMIPNITLTSDRLALDQEVWNSPLSPYSPKGVRTSGITQPPMLAEAVYKVGEKLNENPKKEFYREMILPILRFHQWLYIERDPETSGLIALVHPYESGLDNSPVWIDSVHRLRFPWWVKTIRNKNARQFLNHMRRDTKKVDINQRIDISDAIEYFYILDKLKKYRYDSAKAIRKIHPVIEDIGFNSILIRANLRLKQIAAEINYPLPEQLLLHMRSTEKNLENLWHKKTKLYYSRNYHSKHLIKKPTISSLLPLYSGTLPRDRARVLAAHIDSPEFNTKFPLPSVPINSRSFNPDNFWQGPSWVNTNWLIIQGLENYGFYEQAKRLKARTKSMVEQHGFYEYFSPYDGAGKGSPNFSWTASLYIDLVS